MFPWSLGHANGGASAEFLGSSYGAAMRIVAIPSLMPTWCQYGPLEIEKAPTGGASFLNDTNVVPLAGIEPALLAELVLETRFDAGNRKPKLRSALAREPHFTAREVPIGSGSEIRSPTGTSDVPVQSGSSAHVRLGLILLKNSRTPKRRSITSVSAPDQAQHPVC